MTSAYILAESVQHLTPLEISSKIANANPMLSDFFMYSRECFLKILGVSKSRALQTSAATVTFPCCFSNSGFTIFHRLHTFSSDHRGISIVYTVVSLDDSTGPAIVPALSQKS